MVDDEEAVNVRLILPRAQMQKLKRIAEREVRHVTQQVVFYVRAGLEAELDPVSPDPPSQPPPAESPRRPRRAP